MKIWTIEQKIDGQYLPVTVAHSRDNARALQRYLKTTKAISSSRIRRYHQDTTSRG